MAIDLTPARTAGCSDIIDVYLAEIEAAIRALSRDDVRAIVDVLEAAWQRGSTIFLIGNGGSASTASHMMNDLCKFTRIPGAKLVRAIALTDNVPLMTAFGNDVTYDAIFVEPLRSLMQPGDVVVAISGSGNSPNVLRACEYALANGGDVIGLCGSPGSALAALAPHRIIIPAERIGQQEDGHLIVNHVIALALRDRIEAASTVSAAKAS
jgi:D-sedoheptulose 7-phosphate isomerase